MAMGRAGRENIGALLAAHATPLSTAREWEIMMGA
jgi:hypothetical protein